MSFNKPQKHVMSADRLAFTLLINFYLDLKQKSQINLKHTCFLIQQVQGDHVLSS